METANRRSGPAGSCAVDVLRDDGDESAGVLDSRPGAAPGCMQGFDPVGPVSGRVLHVQLFHVLPVAGTFNWGQVPGRR